MIDYTGARAVPVPIREENGFAFSAEETLSKITPATRLLIINSPANPTGGVTPKAEIDKLVAGLENEVCGRQWTNTGSRMTGPSLGEGMPGSLQFAAPNVPC